MYEGDVYIYVNILYVHTKFDVFLKLNTKINSIGIEVKIKS